MNIIRIPQTQKKLGGCSRMQLYRLEEKAGFPRRVRLGPNSVGHVEAEVDQWLEDRAAERTTEPEAAA